MHSSSTGRQEAVRSVHGWQQLLDEVSLLLYIVREWYGTVAMQKRVMKRPPSIPEAIMVACSVVVAASLCASSEASRDIETAAELRFYGEEDFRESLRKTGLEEDDLHCRLLPKVTVGLISPL